MRSICFNCGTEKRKPLQACRGCGSIPRSDEEKAKSLVLSSVYEIDGELRERTDQELATMSAGIKAGSYVFDDQEIRRIVEAAKEALQVSNSKLFWIFAKWVAPVAMFMLFIFAAARCTNF